MGFEIMITQVLNNEIISEISLTDCNDISKTTVKVENNDCEFID